MTLLFLFILSLLVLNIYLSIVLQKWLFPVLHSLIRLEKKLENIYVSDFKRWQQKGIFLTNNIKFDKKFQKKIYLYTPRKKVMLRLIVIDA